MVCSMIIFILVVLIGSVHITYTLVPSSGPHENTSTQPSMHWGGGIWPPNPFFVHGNFIFNLFDPADGTE